MKTKRSGLLAACVVLAAASQIALAQPVQWPGNGHWYEVVVVDDPISWPDAQAAAVASGGYLATLTSAEENQFVYDLIPPEAWYYHNEWAQGPWLGATDVATEGAWEWVTGEPWNYTNWLGGQPDNWWEEDHLCFWSVGTPGSTWNDARAPQTWIYSYIIEYESLVVAATIDVDPATLNLKSAGKWITCYIELAEDYDVSDIVLGTVQLNGLVPAEPQPTQIGDCDGDGVADLMVKFSRAAVQEILAVGDAVPITVTGELTGGERFEGSDTIRVIAPGGGRK